MLTLTFDSLVPGQRDSTGQVEAKLFLCRPKPCEKNREKRVKRKILVWGTVRTTHVVYPSIVVLMSPAKRNHVIIVGYLGKELRTGGLEGFGFRHLLQQLGTVNWQWFP